MNPTSNSANNNLTKFLVKLFNKWHKHNNIQVNDDKKNQKQKHKQRKSAKKQKQS